MVQHSDKLWRKTIDQSGSLGSGNHFVEVCLDEADNVWVVLHSGSRGVGNEIAKRHIDGAKKIMKRYFIELDDPDLAYFAQGTAEFDAYIHDMLWAQDYALLEPRADDGPPRSTRSTRVLGRAARGGRDDQLPPQLHGARASPSARPLGHPQGRDPRARGRQGHHPRLDGHRHLHRGGARERARLLVGVARRGPAHVTRRRRARPSPRTSSAPRWPARRGTTREAKTLLDEAPAAYKPIEDVMDAQSDLVRVLHTLRQVLNYKGT